MSASTAPCASRSVRPKRSSPRRSCPPGQEQFKKLNAELAKQWPVITEKKDAPADAKEWDGKPDKLKLLER